VTIIIDERELNDVAGGGITPEVVVPLPPEGRALSGATVERLGEHKLAIWGVDIDAFEGIVNVGITLGVFKFNRCDPAVTVIPSTIYVVTPGLGRQNLRSVWVVIYNLRVVVVVHSGHVANADCGLVIIVFKIATAITTDEEQTTQQGQLFHGGTSRDTHSAYPGNTRQ
jgi:hypothetical protein